MKVRVDKHLHEYKVDWIRSFGFTEAQAGLIKRGQLEIDVDNELANKLRGIVTVLDEPTPKKTKTEPFDIKLVNYEQE